MSNLDEPRKLVIQQDRYPVRVTYGLIGLTALIYLLQMLSETLLGVDWPLLLGANNADLVMAGQVWRLFTAAFLHGSLLHIGFNMYALYIIGAELEKVLGPLRFLGLYLSAAFAGNVLSFLFTQSWSIGASTAVFGVLAMEIYLLYRNRDFFGENARTLLNRALGVAAINFFIGLSPGIDNWGHLGGFLGGFLFAALAGPVWKVEWGLDALLVRDERQGARPTLLATAVVLWLFGLLALGRMNGWL